MWTKSFLSGRKQRVHIRNEFSNECKVDHGVLQGTRRGHVLFLLYVSPLCDIVSRHLPSAHSNNDTQLYLSFCPDSHGEQSQAVSALKDCITDSRSWLPAHKLMFKDSKTEFLITGSSFDCHIAMNIQVRMIYSKAFRGLRRIFVGPYFFEGNVDVWLIGACYKNMHYRVSPFFSIANILWACFEEFGGHNVVHRCILLLK